MTKQNAAINITMTAEDKREMAEAEANGAKVREEFIRRAYGIDERKKTEWNTALVYEEAIRGEYELSLTTALAVIAAHFYDPGLRYNRETGQHEQVNTLAYTQRDVLNGFCWTLHQRKANITRQLDEARFKIKREVQMADGTEISLNNIDKAIAWAERIENQLMSVEELIVAAEAAHKVATGTAFVAPKIVPKKEAAKEDPQAAARAAKLRALGINLPAPGQNVTDGVSEADYEAQH